MKVTILPEPQLEFGAGQRHVDPRAGIAAFGPADLGTDGAPTTIRVGFVGDPASVDGAREWLARCREPIDGKETHLRNLFPPWPGFSSDSPFAAGLVFDDRNERLIGDRPLQRLSRMDRDTATLEAVDLFAAEVDSLAESGRVDVIVCARPPELIDEAGTEDGTDGRDHDKENGHRAFDFHDLLKARAMRSRVPIQVMRPTTWDPSRARRQVHDRRRRRQIEDEASRAWNIHAALYYKGGGVPWRLMREPTDLQVCFVGVSFFRTLDREALHTSVAQVFNERGDGVIVRGAEAAISKEDRQPHLTEDDAEALLRDALARYRSEHHTAPARVTMHKSSRFSAAEVGGFGAAADYERLDGLELVWISRRDAGRLFRAGNNPPLRGTALVLDDRRQILYTRGSTPFYAAYPGMYVPRPLAMQTQLGSRSLEASATDVLELTKLNWNQTRLDGRDPITLRTAHRVGGILRYIAADQPAAGRYAFYM